MRKVDSVAKKCSSYVDTRSDPRESPRQAGLDTVSETVTIFANFISPAMSNFSSFTFQARCPPERPVPAEPHTGFPPRPSSSKPAIPCSLPGSHAAAGRPAAPPPSLRHRGMTRLPARRSPPCQASRRWRRSATSPTTCARRSRPRPGPQTRRGSVRRNSTLAEKEVRAWCCTGGGNGTDDCAWPPRAPCRRQAHQQWVHQGLGPQDRFSRRGGASLPTVPPPFYQPDIHRSTGPSPTPPSSLS